MNRTYLVVSSLELQRRLIQSKEHSKSFYSVRNVTAHKPSNLAVAKNFFSSVYITGTTSFDECF